MKELIIEEKAKAYDEAIKRAKAWKTTCSLQEGTVNLIEDIFPELAESEDERIRKALIEYFNEQCDMSDWNGIYGYQVVAWLEKQGEQKPNNNKIEIGKKYKCIASPRYTTFMIGQVYNPNDKFLCSLMNLCSDCFKPFDVIKPQGKSALEAAKEEKVDNQNCVKLADKVEPKFKVRDWVVRGKTIAQILDIQEQYYIGLDIDGNDFTSSRFLSDDKIHLWSIKDAKDGDVLYECNEKKPFIFKELETKHIGDIASYCDIFNDIFNPNEDDWTTLDVVPATKEQRDTLMKAMADAGYTFDFEKKELKKIPNAFEECEIVRVEHGKYYYCIKDYYAGGNKRASKGDVVHALNGMSMMALGVKANEYFIPVNTIKQKNAWSEEDEKMYIELHNLISTPYCGSRKELSDWIKSLKERVQPKQEWSEEDRDYYDAIITKLEVTQDDALLTDNQIEFLKSLRPHKQ